MKILTRGAYAEPAPPLQFKTGTCGSSVPSTAIAPRRATPSVRRARTPRAYLAKVAEGKLREAWRLWSRPTRFRQRPPGLPSPVREGLQPGPVRRAIAIHNVERFRATRRYAGAGSIPSVAPTRPPRRSPGRCGARGPIGRLPPGAPWLQTRRFFDTLTRGGWDAAALAIPSTDCPRDILNREIERLLSIGISSRPQETLGRHLHMTELRAQSKRCRRPR